MSWYEEADEAIRALRDAMIEETGVEPLADLLEEGQTAEELFRDQFDWCYEAVWEAALETLWPVFSLDWDSGGPGGGAGTEKIYEVAGRYFEMSSDGLWAGPYASLDERMETIPVSGATRAIHCDEWSEEEIIERLDFYGGPTVLTINGTEWPFERLELEYERRTGRAVRE